MGFHIVMKGVMGTVESVRQAGFAETSPTIAPFNRDMQRSWHPFVPLP